MYWGAGLLLRLEKTLGPSRGGEPFAAAAGSSPAEHRCKGEKMQAGLLGTQLFGSDSKDILLTGDDFPAVFTDRRKY